MIRWSCNTTMALWRNSTIEPPEDWSGSMDISPEDTPTPEIWPETEDWLRVLERMDHSPL